MAHIEDTPVIGIFMGKGEHPDQLHLAQLRKKQGWIMAESTDDPLYRCELPRFKDAKVIIHGSGAGACVAFAAEDALEAGASVVEVDLNCVKTSGEGLAPLLTRARHFFEQLPSRFSNDSRLIVLPQDIWSQIKRR